MIHETEIQLNFQKTQQREKSGNNWVFQNSSTEHDSIHELRVLCWQTLTKHSAGRFSVETSLRLLQMSK